MTGAVTQAFREPSDLQGSDLKTYKMIPYGNVASKNQWDRERCRQTGKALGRKQNLDLQGEPLWNRSVKVEGPGSGGRRGFL